jgi:hypothetical protein
VIGKVNITSDKVKCPHCNKLKSKRGLHLHMQACAKNHVSATVVHGESVEGHQDEGVEGRRSIEQIMDEIKFTRSTLARLEQEQSNRLNELGLRFVENADTSRP